MTNHKKLIDVTASLNWNCLFFDKRKDVLKIFIDFTVCKNAVT